jgi:Family of unknown function (DUF5670)
MTNALPSEIQRLARSGAPVNRWELDGLIEARWTRQRTCDESSGEESMFIGLFVILVLLWALGFGVMHAAGVLVHLLLIGALISLIIHFVAPSGRSTV